MRLKQSEQAAIRTAIENLDACACIYLFGSRVDDSKKGGDIDLLVLSKKLSGENKRAIRMKLHELIGEQKIDIIIALDDSDPFVKLALQTGVKL